MRTIDAEALKKAIDDYAEKRQDTLLWQSDIEEIIDNAPTVEPKQGEWITKGQDVYCSICNQESAYNEFGASKFSNFCPNCGADMWKGGAE